MAVQKIPLPVLSRHPRSTSQMAVATGLILFTLIALAGAQDRPACTWSWQRVRCEPLAHCTLRLASLRCEPRPSAASKKQASKIDPAPRPKAEDGSKIDPAPRPKAEDGAKIDPAPRPKAEDGVPTSTAPRPSLQEQQPTQPQPQPQPQQQPQQPQQQQQPPAWMAPLQRGFMLQQSNRWAEAAEAYALCLSLSADGPWRNDAQRQQVRLLACLFLIWNWNAAECLCASDWLL